MCLFHSKQTVRLASDGDNDGNGFDVDKAAAASSEYDAGGGNGGVGGSSGSRRGRRRARSSAGSSCPLLPATAILAGLRM